MSGEQINHFVRAPLAQGVRDEWCHPIPHGLVHAHAPLHEHPGSARPTGGARVEEHRAEVIIHRIQRHARIEQHCEDFNEPASRGSMAHRHVLVIPHVHRHAPADEVLDDAGVVLVGRFVDGRLHAHERTRVHIVFTSPHTRAKSGCTIYGHVQSPRSADSSR